MSDREYQDLIQCLFSVNRFRGCRLGLQNIQQLNELMGSPEKAFSSVHVAGTNGKGSVTTKIAKVLQLSGYRVGCYTSPHLSCFRERIQVNGQLITEAEVSELLSRVLETARHHQIPATFFELTTALAFMHFAQQRVEVAVLETGLGGRLDATNSVTPVLSVITSIGLEHTDVLGSTREKIAWEKGGIIKPGVPVVMGPHADLPMIREIADQAASVVVLVAPVEGDFDAENRAIAWIALERLQGVFPTTDQALEAGLHALSPSRFERIPPAISLRSGFSVLPDDIILDVAHNPDAIFRLVQALDVHYPNRNCHFVCGFSKGKDVVSCLKILNRRAKTITLVSARHERALSLSALRQGAVEAELSSSVTLSEETIRGGLEQGCQLAALKGDVLVVCGSFFIMSEVRTCFGYREPVDEQNLNECLVAIT